MSLSNGSDLSLTKFYGNPFSFYFPKLTLQNKLDSKVSLKTRLQAKEVGFYQSFISNEVGVVSKPTVYCTVL